MKGKLNYCLIAALVAMLIGVAYAAWDGATNFPGALDTSTTLYDVEDTDTIEDEHHDAVAQAIIAIQTKMGTGADVPADGEVFIGTGAGTSGYENEATFKASVNLEIGTDVQAYHAALASIAGLTEADVSVIEATADNAYNVVTSGGGDRFLSSNTGNTALEFKALLYSHLTAFTETNLYTILSDVSMFLEDAVDDTTPQLGGDLDLNSKTILDTCVAFASTDATPDVSVGSWWKTANAGATTISDFDDADDHSEFTQNRLILVWIADGNTTIELDGSEIIWASQGTNNYACTVNDIFLLMYDAGNDKWNVVAGPMPSVVSLSELVLPQGTDPDVDTTGEVSYDTDAGNETNDESLRGFDGTNQFVLATKLKRFQFSIPDPENLTSWTGRANPSQPVWYNDSGFSFTIIKVRGVSDTDNYDFTLFESSSATDLSDENDTSIIAMECDANGTEAFTDEEVGMTHVIENNHYVIFEDTLGAAEGVQVVMTGWFNGDVD